MNVIKNFLTNGAESEYFEALQLNDISSKQDPETDPYRSMYKAREIWHRLKSEIDRHREETPNDSWNFLDAVLDLKLGVNYAETEEKSTGEEHLLHCVTNLTSHQVSVEACCILLTAYNQIGILHSDRGDPKTGLSYLDKAEKVYDEFQQKVGGVPWTVDDTFRGDCYESDAGLEKFLLKRTENFEEMHTLTLYYLAQVHTKLEARQTAASYCRMTLCRQLESHKYQPVEWSMNAATLSQYYVTESQFNLARHCLASAECVLKEGGSLGSPETNKPNEDEMERRSQAWADLYRCWVKYGLALLEYSKERLYQELDAEDDHLVSDATTVQQNREDITSNDEDWMKTERFFDLELTAFESRITDKPVCVFDEARQVFKAVKSWLQAANMFYALDGHCSDHVELVRDHSRLYKILAFFEPNLDRQCRMHKRRADMLSELLKVLNRQFYLLVCRQLMFELGEIYSAMLDNKLARIEEAGTAPDEHARAKINSLVWRSIEQFQAYVDSLKKPDGKLPGTFQDDDERPALIAHFYMGRLFSKLMDFDVSTRLNNMKKSIDNYGFLVDYCKHNPAATEKVKSERDLCEEMVSLLPAKMDKIRSLSS